MVFAQSILIVLYHNPLFITDSASPPYHRSAPVITMMTLSATTHSWLWAIAYGAVFGLGATL